MEFKGEYIIPADRETVWQALNNPDILKASIPGCEELLVESDDRFNARLFAKVGPVQARFKGTVTLANLNPPESYELLFEGNGGVAGFAKGSALVRLDVVGEGTCLSYAANASIGGKLAQIGQRLVDSSAKKMADDFFGEFSRHAAPDVVMPSGEASADVDLAKDAQGASAAPSQRSRSALIWMAGALVAAVLFWWLAA